LKIESPVSNQYIHSSHFITTRVRTIDSTWEKCSWVSGNLLQLLLPPTVWMIIAKTPGKKGVLCQNENFINNGKEEWIGDHRV
jgi:hypothetical protein